jgi:uncharacterized protein YaiL (DUF2058 family)
MQSLRDKLLKAGLVSEDQAKKAESEIVVKRAPPPPREAVDAGRGAREERGPREDRGPRAPDRRGPPPRGAPPAGRRGPERAPTFSIPKLPPLPGSRAFQREESKKQLELDKRVRDLVTEAQVPTDVGATVFYFMTRKKKLRRLELTQEQAARLESGELAVVELPNPDRIDHALVPSAAADALIAFFPKAVRFYNRAENPIGFMSDDDVKAQQEVEANAPEEDAEAGEGAESGDEPATEAPETQASDEAPPTSGANTDPA